MAAVWEISAVTENLRGLGCCPSGSLISLDQFERRRDEIKDQPEFGVDGKPLFASSGRSVMLAAPLPVSKDSSLDWYTTNPKKAAAELDTGEYRGLKVWIKDYPGASMFVLAVQRAMPNTKRRRRCRGSAAEQKRRKTAATPFHPELVDALNTP